jgi:hypothetical protein
MHSMVAPKLEAAEESTPSPTPARVVSLCPSGWDRIRTWAGKTVTVEKREEVVGITFIFLSFFLVGWFYYSLYQVPQDYKVF